MIPSTPAATAKALPAIPVRHIAVARATNGIGDQSYDTSFATEFVPDAGVCHEDDLYTLLPPHLAERWRELRKVEDHAWQELEAHAKLFHDIRGDGSMINAFRVARNARIAFEQQNGIGGGA